eukprot:3687813-Pleurochrysis_carterae.AAC.1
MCRARPAAVSSAADPPSRLVCAGRLRQPYLPDVSGGRAADRKSGAVSSGAATGTRRIGWGRGRRGGRSDEECRRHSTRHQLRGKERIALINLACVAS